MSEPEDDVLIEDRMLCLWRPLGHGWEMVGDRRHHIFEWSEVEPRGPFAIYERREL